MMNDESITYGVKGKALDKINQGRELDEKQDTDYRSNTQMSGGRGYCEAHLPVQLPESAPGGTREIFKGI